MTVGQRSRLMARIKGQNTSPERYVHELAEAAGLSFERHEASLPGRPDLVFSESRLAVFINGDFWHGWRFPVWRHRLAPFWEKKISGNRLRDQKNYRKLRRLGWRVLRLWEHQIEENVVQCVSRLGTLAGIPIDQAALEAKYAAMPRLKRRKRLPKP
jgi:DNA mismatch endonuclease (patch repair protein)